jgi:hypothetical protein
MFLISELSSTNHHHHHHRMQIQFRLSIATGSSPGPRRPSTA